MKKVIYFTSFFLLVYLLFGITKKWWPVDWWVVQLSNEGDHGQVKILLADEIKWTGRVNLLPINSAREFVINTPSASLAPAKLLFADLTWPPGYVRFEINGVVLNLRKNGVTVEPTGHSERRIEGVAPIVVNPPSETPAPR